MDVTKMDIIGRVTTIPIKYETFDSNNEKVGERELPKETYNVVDIFEENGKKFYVTNRWYKEYKQVPLIIIDGIVESYEPITIKCHNCSWTWAYKDGGDDKFICHKCGTNNSKYYKNGGQILLAPNGKPKQKLLANGKPSKYDSIEKTSYGFYSKEFGRFEVILNENSAIIFLNKKSNGEKDAFLYLENIDNKGYIELDFIAIDNENFRRKGLGTLLFYLALTTGIEENHFKGIKSLFNSSFSDNPRSKDAERMWDILSSNTKFYVNKKGFDYYIKLANNVRFISGGNVLLAPNGKPSNLTPEQYALVRTPAFKKWFGDWENSPESASKVVDENGEPLVVYRGVHKNQVNSTGFWLTNSKSYAESFGDINEYFVSIKNPMPEELFDKTWFVDYEKYDGRLGGFHKIVVEKINQIKLADGTNTTFDSNNPDIRYAGGGEINNIQLLKHSVINDFQSGSSLDFYMDYIFVVGDDAKDIVILNKELQEVNRVNVFQSETQRIPKEIKYDLETSTIVDIDGVPNLLILGSGAKQEFRSVGYLIRLDTKYVINEPFRYNTFVSRLKNEDSVKEINIEGCASLPNKFVMANRGNKRNPDNLLIITENRFWENQGNAAISICRILIPDKDAAVSEIQYEQDTDTLFFTASIEHTTNAIDDGKIGDSFLGYINNISEKLTKNTIDVDGFYNLSLVDKAFEYQKIEGICIESKEKEMNDTFYTINLVSDNDNEESTIFKIRFKKPN